MAAKLGGIGVFVKTPELSAVKTRLAADIGKTAALAVYEKMLLKTATMMRQVEVDGGAAYWAVGEADGVSHLRWRAFPAMWTGDGGLGKRLHRIYSMLQKKHECAAVAGADCPQLSAAAVLSALQRAREKIVVGPTTDGGFYLFAAARPIDASVWQSVAYSQNDTLEKLLRHFPATAVERLKTLSDVDDKKSLAANEDLKSCLE